MEIPQNFLNSHANYYDKLLGIWQSACPSAMHFQKLRGKLLQIGVVLVYSFCSLCSGKSDQDLETIDSHSFLPTFVFVNNESDNEVTTSPSFHLCFYWASQRSIPVIFWRTSPITIVGVFNLWVRHAKLPYKPDKSYFGIIAFFFIGGSHQTRKQKAIYILLDPEAPNHLLFSMYSHDYLANAKNSVSFMRTSFRLEFCPLDLNMRKDKYLVADQIQVMSWFLKGLITGGVSFFHGDSYCS